jgi:hypothetical protein
MGWNAASSFCAAFIAASSICLVFLVPIPQVLPALSLLLFFSALVVYPLAGNLGLAPETGPALTFLWATAAVLGDDGALLSAFAKSGTREP